MAQAHVKNEGRENAKEGVERKNESRTHKRGAEMKMEAAGWGKCYGEGGTGGEIEEEELWEGRQMERLGCQTTHLKWKCLKRRTRM